MAHEIDRMAYVGDVPWHGLGTQLDPDASVDEWKEHAGLSWKVDGIPIFQEFQEYLTQVADFVKIEGFQALRRDDNRRILGVVSDRYKIVQPSEVLEFYRDLAKAGKLKIETAGSLRYGQRVWALANTGQEYKVNGIDAIRRYVLLATGYDGNFGTTAFHTTVRVVCNNTLQMAMEGLADRVTVPHYAKFDGEAVRQLLGLEEPFEKFGYQIERLTDRKVIAGDAYDYFSTVYYGESYDWLNHREHNKKQLEKIDALYGVFRTAPGQEISTTRGTAWGLVNAVTHYEDFLTPEREKGNRLNRSWWGEGRRLKKRAFDEALALAA